MHLVFRKNPGKWNYGWSSVLKTYIARIVGIFERICCFDEVFLMALTSREQLFIERPLYRPSCIMITYPISSNLRKKISLQCYRLYNFLSFRNSHWRYSVRKGVIRNFAKFTGKHLRQSLFLINVAGWCDCFWSFSCLLLKISSLFNFNRKTKWKKRNYPVGVQIITFLLEYRFDWRHRFQKKFYRWLFDQKICLKGIWCCSFHG